MTITEWHYLAVPGIDWKTLEMAETQSYIDGQRLAHWQ